MLWSQDSRKRLRAAQSHMKQITELSYQLQQYEQTLWVRFLIKKKIWMTPPPPKYWLLENMKNERRESFHAKAILPKQHQWK